MSANHPGPCNRCDGHKKNVLGLCEHCHRFPKSDTPAARRITKSIVNDDFTF